jgi:hypothetical protein
MSFVLACFHLIVFCIILARNTFASVFHDGCWLLKFVAVMVAFGASLWIPNSFFEWYMVLSRYVSIVFLLAQALLMMVVAYKINDKFVGNYE